MTVPRTVIFIRRLEIRTSGSWFSLFLAVHKDNFWLKKLKIGIAIRRYSLHEYESVSSRLGIRTDVGKFFCARLPNDNQLQNVQIEDVNKLF